MSLSQELPKRHFKRNDPALKTGIHGPKSLSAQIRNSKYFEKWTKSYHKRTRNREKSTVHGFLFEDILWACYSITTTGVPGLNGVPGCLTVSIILMGEKQSLMTKKPISRNDSGKESSHRWCTDLIRNRYFLGSLIQVSQLLQSKLFRNDHRWRSCIVRFWRTGGFRKS